MALDGSAASDPSDKPSFVSTSADVPTEPAPGDSTRALTWEDPARPPNARKRRVSNSSVPTINTSALRSRRVSRSNTIKTIERKNWQPGAEPGIDPETEPTTPRRTSGTNTRHECCIQVIDYGETFKEHNFSKDTLEDFLGQPRPEDAVCRWINVSGLDKEVVLMLGRKFNLHRLALEDLLHTNTRTKVDWYSDHAFIVLTLQKLVRLHYHDEDIPCDCPAGSINGPNGYDPENAYQGQNKGGPSWGKHKHNDDALPRFVDQTTNHSYTGPSEMSNLDGPLRPVRTLHRYEPSANEEHTAYMERHSALAYEGATVSVEQVAIFLTSDNTVLSFFEHSGDDVHTPIRDRLESTDTIPRQSADGSMLLQAIIDTIVDLSLPIKEAYNRARKEMQIDVLTNPDVSTSKSLYVFGEEVDILQNLFRPIVQLVTQLRDHTFDQSQSMAASSGSWGGQSGPAPGNNRLSPNPGLRQDAVGYSPDFHTAGEQRRPMWHTSSFHMTTSVTITPLTHTYLGDVLDHCITMMKSLEQMDASAHNLSSLIFNTVGANTNNFLMILALVTVFFAPLTFISGYFGMNFHSFNAIETRSDGFFWLVAMPSVSFFMLVVSGKTVWHAIANRWAKLKIHTKRKQRIARGGLPRGQRP